LRYFSNVWHVIIRIFLNNRLFSPVYSCLFWSAKIRFICKKQTLNEEILLCYKLLKFSSKKANNLTFKNHNMKQLTNSKCINSLQKTIVAVILAIGSFLTSVQAFAQAAAEKVDVDINTNDGPAGWYTQPWVWVVGVAVFIVIIVAITRGGSRRDA
jgi:hypothetical protein